MNFSGTGKENKMKIRCTFSGCSCGCTPYESVTFEGEEPDIYVAIACWAQEYMIRGDAPFTRLEIPVKSQEILLAWRNLRNESDTLVSKKNALVKKENAYKEASKTLGVKIPDEKLREIETNEATIIEIDGKLAELANRRTALLAYEKASRIQEEE